MLYNASSRVARASCAIPVKSEHLNTTDKDKMMKAKMTEILFSLSFISYLVSVLGQSSYCNFSPDHTLCKHEGIGPACGQPLARRLEEEEKRMVVDYHNR